MPDAELLQHERIPLRGEDGDEPARQRHGGQLRGAGPSQHERQHGQ